MIARFLQGAVALAVLLAAAGLTRRTRSARRAERQAAREITAYVASLAPDEIAEILAGPDWRTT